MCQDPRFNSKKESYMSQATATVPFSRPPLTDVFGQRALYEAPVPRQCQVTRVN